MFLKNKETDSKKAVQHEKVSIIAGGMQLSGDVESEGDIRIDGSIQGNIFCKSKVVVISTGKVTGDIHAVNVDVHGTVEGNITARDLLSLKSKCNVTGNLATEKLQIEPNAIFNGHCTMTFDEKPAVVTEGGLILSEN